MRENKEFIPDLNVRQKAVFTRHKKEQYFIAKTSRDVCFLFYYLRRAVRIKGAHL